MERNETRAILESGIVPQHMEAFKNIANQENVFILFRPVNKNSTALIAQGYGTKGLDIHAKSSDWGPQAGFICTDQDLSKKFGDAGAVGKGNQDVVASLSKAHIVDLPLVITQERHRELMGEGKYAVKHREEHMLTLHQFKGDARYHMKLIPFQSLESSGIEGVAQLKQKIEGMGQKIQKLHEGYLVVYAKSEAPLASRPVFVLGYKDPGVPVTADYDVFAICPSLSRYSDAYRKRLEAIPTGVTKKEQITAKWQALGKTVSEALGQRERRTVDPNMGQLTGLQRKIVQMMNDQVRGLGYRGGNVVHHGTEQDNIHYPEQDGCIAVVTPKGTVFRTDNWVEVQQVAKEILRSGYILYANKSYNIVRNHERYHEEPNLKGFEWNTNFTVWAPVQPGRPVKLTHR